MTRDLPVCLVLFIVALMCRPPSYLPYERPVCCRVSATRLSGSKWCVVQGVCVDRRERNQVLAPSARLEGDRSFPRQGIDCDEYLVPGAGGESIGQCIQCAGALLFQLSDNEGLCLIELGHVIPL